VIGYCTNVHPAEDLAGVVAQFDRYAEPVRRLVAADVLPVGLWLPAGLAGALAADQALRTKLRSELDARGLEVYTLNAFPYGGFHDEVVKHSVYRPEWTSPRRLEYTVDCAKVLADLLPDSATYGSISTLPLAWREPWGREDDDLATAALGELTAVLDAMARANGRPIRLAIEPEPGCVLDTVADAVRWLAPRVDPRYVGLCLDACHLAVSFADPADTVAEIYDAGLEVVKVQASAALQVDEPASEQARLALADFTEPRYLHQVRERTRDGAVLGADDLPQALTELPGEQAWRVHFHVPLHARPAAPLSATTDVLRTAITTLESMVDGPLPHIEVETYTWSVLPETAGNGGDTALIRGIAAELRWAAAQLLSHEKGVS
jgi:sugar phosphate isomerase/epimerase